jgi:hypothetical protein
MKTYSYHGQDIFVQYCTKFKKNGTFLEIGANMPIVGNNTYILENDYNWKGIMIEYNPQYIPEYKLHRPNSTHVINDATNINYYNLLHYNLFPTNIDYLQIDLEVENRSTLTCLEDIAIQILDTYKFATVTFEHDVFRDQIYNTRDLSREIFLNHGYILVFQDVMWSHDFSLYDENKFEDWYVHPDLVDMDHIRKIMTSETLNYREIVKRINKAVM